MQTKEIKTDGIKRTVLLMAWACYPHIDVLYSLSNNPLRQGKHRAHVLVYLN